MGKLTAWEPFQPTVYLISQYLSVVDGRRLCDKDNNEKQVTEDDKIKQM
jgi:hypothetical protein